MFSLVDKEDVRVSVLANALRFTNVQTPMPSSSTTSYSTWVEVFGSRSFLYCQIFSKYFLFQHDLTKILVHFVFIVALNMRELEARL